MANKERIANEFMELVKIDSLSLCEREVADILVKKLKEIGLSVTEDDTGKKIGGNAGNVIGILEGNKKLPGILLMAHMDTVGPGKSKEPIREGDIIKTNGTTILGGDDLAGVVCVLEALREIVSESVKHGDIYVAFTVAEEIGLLGVSNLDLEKINAKYGFVFDEGGKIGTVAVSAPSQNTINMTFYGKAAHAGIEPENGINAIQIASKAILDMKLGRIDEMTTANVGTISGGLASNIVCERVEIKSEARSRNEKKLIEQTEFMKKCAQNAAEEFGGRVEFNIFEEYKAFIIKEKEEIISVVKTAADRAGVELVPEVTGGGSDTNILNVKGIKSVNVSVGMQKIHSTEEIIDINDLLKATEFLKEIIIAVE